MKLSEAIEFDGFKPCTQTIYMIVNTVTNGRYVGISTSINTRFKTHLKNLMENKHHSKKMQTDFNKHGADSFEANILEYHIGDYGDGFDKESGYILSEQANYNRPVSRMFLWRMNVKAGNVIWKQSLYEECIQLRRQIAKLMKQKSA